MPASSSQRDPLAVGGCVGVPHGNHQNNGPWKYRTAEITEYRSPSVVTVRFADDSVSNAFLPDLVPIDHWSPFTNAIGRVNHNGNWEACRVTRAKFNENSGKWVFRVEVTNPAGFPKERKGISFRNLDLSDLQTNEEIDKRISEVAQVRKTPVAVPEFRMDPQEDWQSASIILNKNELRILGHPVMQRWEEPYMKRLAEICTARGGTVLEIGYGMGISANVISQQPKVQKHVFVEGNQQVFQNALKWTTEENRKARRSKVQGQFGFWEDVLPDMAGDRYDGILFDPYPFDGEDITDGTTTYAFFKQAARLLKFGGILTFFSGRGTALSPLDVDWLEKLGFQVRQELVKVATPKDCEYWSGDTMVAPICILQNKKTDAELEEIAGFVKCTFRDPRKFRDCDRKKVEQEVKGDAIHVEMVDLSSSSTVPPDLQELAAAASTSATGSTKRRARAKTKAKAKAKGSAKGKGTSRKKKALDSNADSSSAAGMVEDEETRIALDAVLALEEKKIIAAEKRNSRKRKRVDDSSGDRKGGDKVPTKSSSVKKRAAKVDVSEASATSAKPAAKALGKDTPAEEKKQTVVEAEVAPLVPVVDAAKTPSQEDDSARMFEKWERDCADFLDGDDSKAGLKNCDDDGASESKEAKKSSDADAKPPQQASGSMTRVELDEESDWLRDEEVDYEGDSGDEVTAEEVREKLRSWSYGLPSTDL